MRNYTKLFTNSKILLSSLTGFITLTLIVSSARGALAQDMKKLNAFVQNANGEDPAITLFRSGRDLIEDENWDAAAKRFQEFLSRHPKHKDSDAALYWLAFALKKRGDFQEADRSLDKLIQKYPSSNWLDDARVMRLELAPKIGNTVIVNQTINEPNDKENEEIKMIALQSLMRSNSERAVEYLNELLSPESKSSSKLKETAVNLLGQTSDPRATTTLIRIAQGKGDVRLRQKAIFWLGQHSSAETLATLKEIALAGENEETAKSALFAISQQTGAQSREFLLEIARNEKSAKLRYDAIFFLSQRTDEGTIDALARLYEGESDVKVKKRIIFSLSQISDLSASEKIFSIARSDQNETLRQEAIFWLGQRGGEKTITSLVQLYDNEKSVTVKEKLLFAFSQSPGKSALQKLFQVAKTDASLDLRKKAVFWIGQRSDPEAVKFLEELLK